MEQYRVSMYIDQIRKVKINEAEFNCHDWEYSYFNSYFEAKDFLVKRHKTKIVQMEKELKKLKNKLPKLLSIVEKSY